MDATKSRGRSKVFNCFKPIVDDDYDDGDAAVIRKKRLRRSFSAALKAVLFKSSLLRKSRSEKSNEDCDGRWSNFFFKFKRSVDSKKNNAPCKAPLGPEDIFRTNSDRSSIFSSNSNSTPSLASSSSASSCSSHSRSGSDNIGRSVSLDLRKVKSKRRDPCGRKCSSNSKNNYTFVFEMCVLLVCLGALVWGKVFAIVVCTSTWLFFTPASRRHKPHQRIRRANSLDVVVDSAEYKKRVVMEGLLERNR